MKIFSVNVGLPSESHYDGSEVFTGGAKRPAPQATPRFDCFDGLAGRLHHDGRALFAKRLGRKMVQWG